MIKTSNYNEALTLILLFDDFPYLWALLGPEPNLTQEILTKSLFVVLPRATRSSLLPPRLPLSPPDPLEACNTREHLEMLLLLSLMLLLILLRMLPPESRY